MDYAQGTGFINGYTEQQIVGGVIQSDLSAYGWRSPFADSGVQLLLGVEYRNDKLESSPDDISKIPAGRGLTGVGGAALEIAGEVRVAEIFTETQIPLITGEQFIEELNLNGAYRYSDYGTEGGDLNMHAFDTHTFAVGANWLVTPDIRLRSQFQRAVRAPNVIELFTGQNTATFAAIAGPNDLYDPCAGDFDSATPIPEPSASFEQCAFSGVTASQYGAIPDNPVGQLNAVIGGNPKLQPEKANTITAGAVMTPAFAPELRFSVDYFDITVKDVVGPVPPQLALGECIATGDPSFCDLIVRDQFGSLFIDNSNFEGVQAISTNIAMLKTRGLDFAATYNYEFGKWGALNFNLAATYLLEHKNTPIQGFPAGTDCAGFYAVECGAAMPVYRHRMVTTWQTPWDVDIMATWRYYSQAKNIDVYRSETPNPTGNVIDDLLDSANYLDVSAEWFMRENIAVRAGVNNIFGRDPELQTPISSAPGNGNTLPGSYDPAGRAIFFGVTIRG